MSSSEKQCTCSDEIKRMPGAYGLKVEAKSVKKLNFTHETTEFCLLFHNMIGDARKGKINLMFFYGLSYESPPPYFQTIDIDDIPAGGHYQHHVTFPNATEGNAHLIWLDYGSPEELAGNENEILEKAAKEKEPPPGIFLTSVKIIDKNTYEIENKRFEKLTNQIGELRKEMKRTINETIEARMNELGLTKEGIGKVIIEQRNNNQQAQDSPPDGHQKPPERKPEYLG